MITMPRPRKSQAAAKDKREPFPSEKTTDSVSARVPVDQKQAIELLGDLYRRTASSELGIAIEKHLRDNEAILREHGKWPASLDNRSPVPNKAKGE